MLLLLTTSLALASVETGCTRAREFIATLEYLRSAKELSLAEPEARGIAQKVTDAACSGSGYRFVRVSQLLLKVGLSGSDSLKVGLEFAARDDRQTETFLGVFMKAIQSDHHDLDVASAPRIA
jgi:hypothetical protein